MDHRGKGGDNSNKLVIDLWVPLDCLEFCCVILKSPHKARGHDQVCSLVLLQVAFCFFSLPPQGGSLPWGSIFGFESETFI